MKLRGRTEGSTALGGKRAGGRLSSSEIQRLITDLEATRWTGRPGYPIRAMVGMALTRSLYAI